MGINSIVLSGRLGANPEIKYLDNGTCIVNASLAVSVYRSKGNSETIWVSIKGFSSTAENFNDFCKKGDAITISGRFDIESWESNGVKKTKPVIIMNDFQMPSRDKEDEIEDDLPF